MAISAQKKLLLPIFFLSGFSALIYEVIWARLLALSFGSTFEAVSAVITAFMAGLAIGSYLMGKWADRHKDVLYLYSVTELSTGILSLLLYFVIAYLPDIYSTFPKLVNIETSFIFLDNGKYILEFLLVFIPATVIGATFPLMVKSYVSSRNFVGEGLSLIYSVNTLGAVFGAFFTGFYFIPAIGVRWTVFTAVATNLFLALLSYLIRRFYPSIGRASLTSVIMPANERERGTQFQVDRNRTKPFMAISILIVLTISGFASLSYQVAWTRVLTMVIGNSVYAFSTILTTFLAGIAIGSFAFIKQLDKIRDKVLLLGVLQLSLFILVIIFLPKADSLPVLFLALFKNLPSNFLGIIVIEFIVTFSVVLLPTILMGATFPVAARIYINAVDNIGEGLGRLYAVNTVGAIFGSFLTGFIFIPVFGVQKTIFFISALNLLSGIILIIQAERVWKIFRIAVPAASITFLSYNAFTIHDWDKNILNRGVYLYAEWIKSLSDNGVSLNDYSREFKLVSYKEGRHGTVSVTKTVNGLSLQINGKTDAGTTDMDMRTQTLIAALPLIAHPDPKNIAMIGLGSGVSLGTAEQFPVERIDCIEIMKEVVKANRYFSTFNHNALNDPKSNLIIGDGRNHLMTTNKKYDVIISEPSNPWITGVSNIFTSEYFRIAKNRLNKNGIMCQWFQLYSIDTTELKILLNTFGSAFPHISVWAFSSVDLIVLGSEDPITMEDSRLDDAFSTLSIFNDLLRIGIKNKEDIKAAYLMGEKELKRFCAGAKLNTDDKPIVEFEAPKALYRVTEEKNISALRNAGIGR